MGDDRTKSDMEHYTRMAQNIIDEFTSSIGPPLWNPEMERPDLVESELVERLMADAAMLAKSYVELLTWLQQAGNRTAGTLGGKRGNERVPRRPKA